MKSMFVLDDAAIAIFTVALRLTPRGYNAQDG